MNPKKNRVRAFTVVELLIAVAVIAIVAALAMPVAVRSLNRARTVHVVNELRTNGEAVQMFTQEKGTYPPTSPGFNQVPQGMDTYLPKNNTWQLNPTNGGYGYWYFWNFSPTGIWGFNTFVAIYNPDFTSEMTQLIDSSLDDGDPNAGQIRVLSNSWILYGVN